MTGELSEALQPVFLEPRDDYWEIHEPNHLSMAEQRAYRLVPRATAEQLKNIFYCEDCFPHTHPEHAR